MLCIYFLPSQWLVFLLSFIIFCSIITCHLHHLLLVFVCLCVGVFLCMWDFLAQSTLPTTGWMKPADWQTLASARAHGRNSSFMLFKLLSFEYVELNHRGGCESHFRWMTSLWVVWGICGPQEFAPIYAMASLWLHRDGICGTQEFISIYANCWIIRRACPSVTSWMKSNIIQVSLSPLPISRSWNFIAKTNPPNVQSFKVNIGEGELLLFWGGSLCPKGCSHTICTWETLTRFIGFLSEIIKTLGGIRVGQRQGELEEGSEVYMKKVCCL